MRDRGSRLCWHPSNLAHRKLALQSEVHARRLEEHAHHDAKFVEVATSTLSAERLLEGDLDIVDVISVPSGPKELITKSQNQNILDHFLA